VVLVTVGVTVLLAYPAPLLARAGALPLAAACAAGVGLVVALAVALRRRRAAAADSRLRRAVRAARSDLRMMLRRGTWPGVLLASAVVLGGHLATFVVAARAAGATAPLTRLVPLALLALLAMTLPLSVGGWGPREGVTAWAFGAVGLSAAQGLTVAIVYGLFAFVAALPGLAVLIARWLERFREAPALPAPVPAPLPAAA
jgi:uncharacterized membrane protein YbhN (UPF0104 family)